MSSYRNILYHLVFHTKGSQKTIDANNIRELFAYIMKILDSKHCKLYRINGVEDHVHILCDLHPSIALADLMRDIKTRSSHWMKQSNKFPRFSGWAESYGAFTYAYRDKTKIVQYIINQQEHHKKLTYEKELQRLVKEQGLTFDEKYFP
jgi:putative transposase